MISSAYLACATCPIFQRFGTYVNWRDDPRGGHYDFDEDALSMDLSDDDFIDDPLDEDIPQGAI